VHQNMQRVDAYTHTAFSGGCDTVEAMLAARRQGPGEPFYALLITTWIHTGAEGIPEDIIDILSTGRHGAEKDQRNAHQGPRARPTRARRHRLRGAS